jgi:tetratricopeptide (TPR) repeat protein
MRYWWISRGFVLVLLLGAALPASGQAGGLAAARARADQGHARELAGAHEDAIADLSQAIAMHALPAVEEAHLLFDRGVIRDALGRLDAAADDYSATLQVMPRFAPALNNRANVYRRQNRLAEARRDYMASLAAGNPQPEYPWCGLGEVAEAEGDMVTARESYAHAVAANPAYGIAAERLSALGGHVNVLASDQVIHLRPPHVLVAADNGPIHLKPPPKTHAAATSVPQADAPSPPNFAPARYEVEQDPGLRPALDKTASFGVQIQLGAWRTEEEAGAGWNKARQQAGNLLDGLSPHIVAADLPGRGRYYRLRAGPVQQAVPYLCRALVARGLNCIAARD